MTTPATPPQAPATEAIELDLLDGVVCLAEWTSTAASSTAIAVLLHDEQLDLDSMRPLARALVRVGVPVLSLDLPGHGLSGGDYAIHGPAAIEAAQRLAKSRGAVDLAFVAHGESGCLLRGADVVPGFALVCVDVRVAGPVQEPGWSHVPAVLFLDPLDPELVSCADEMIAHRQAWTLRVDVHPLASNDSDDTTRRDPARMGDPTIVATATRFLHEQTNYAKARRARQGSAKDD